MCKEFVMRIARYLIRAGCYKRIARYMIEQSNVRSFLAELRGI